jgi:polyisoprenoid-binding protein YceI
MTGAQADHHEEAAIDTSSISAGSYTADAGHSMVAFGVDHLGFNDYYGIFGNVSGTLELDTEDPSNSSVNVTVPVASVIVPSEGLRNHLLAPGRDGGKPDFFGPEPVAATFVSTGVELTGGTSATVTGDLTLNGVTKPVSIDAEISGVGTNGMSQKKTVGFHGSTVLKRSDFGIDFGIPFGIGDDVELYITVAFEQ